LANPAITKKSDYVMAWMNGDFLIEFGENLADLQDKIEIL